jgi:hypothetical protein
MTTQTQARVAAPVQGRRRAGMATAVIGVAYTISWIAGLAVNALAGLAYVAGVLLLVFIPGAAIALRRAGGR